MSEGMTPLQLIHALVLGLLSPQDQVREPARGCLTAELTAAVAAAPPLEPAAPLPGEGLPGPIDKQLTFARLYLPRGFGASAGNCDLVIHFHGAPETTIPAFDAAGRRSAGRGPDPRPSDHGKEGTPTSTPSLMVN
jgi:hypothetical protein